VATNPLKKYFRQPKIYVNLPSKGAYNPPGSLAGDSENMPVFGMTGMDELMMKTPDALLNGESTVKVIESCCPVIKDAWELTVLDLDLLLTAIRIATYGNTMTITHTCPSCESINDYDIDLGNIIEHFNHCIYDNKIVLKDLSINIKPLTYKQWTELQLKNFSLQRQLQQVLTLEDEVVKNENVTKLFEQLNYIQKETLTAQIDSVEVVEGVVNQQEFIQEWVANSEQLIFDSIRERIEANLKAWNTPPVEAECPECKTMNSIQVNMDQSSFFGRA